MFKNKLRKIKFKKLLFYPFALLFVVTITLAFVPHYSCACGNEGNKKANGSMLSHHVEKIAENIASAIRDIFN